MTHPSYGLVPPEIIQKARTAHPDNGGNHDRMAEPSRAITEARRNEP